LSLEAQAPLGLRRDDLIVKDVAPEVRARYERDYISWRNQRTEAISAAKRPSIEIIAATQAASTGEILPGSAIDVRVEDLGNGLVRPGGARFGTLVHALLADLPLDSSAAGVLDRLAAAQGRVLGATSEEIDVAKILVRRVLQHPLWACATQASAERRCYREAPVTLRLDSGVLVEGNVDLAYHDEDHIVVVDFKTDRDLAGALDVYRRQVQIYGRAIAMATGHPVRGVLVRL
jgi:ATP-dependent exoDNAse (exonuclease V) beta subunit